MLRCPVDSTLAVVFSGALLALPANALAHARLTSPVPRSADDGLKTGPCGGVIAGATRTELMGGSTITVGFEETINHPGWFRVAVSLSGDLDFDAHVLADNIAHIDDGRTGYLSPARQYSQQIVIPDVACEACTLQLIQVMTDRPLGGGDYQKYYSCADVRIVSTTPVIDAGSAQDAGSVPPDAGLSGGDAGQLSVDSGPGPLDSGANLAAADAGVGASAPRGMQPGSADDSLGGGCRCAQPATSSASLWATLLLLFAAGFASTRLRRPGLRAENAREVLERS